MATIRERATSGANPRTPTDTLRDLATDNNWQVRAAVASNPNTRSELLTMLANDDHLLVRLGVADNPQPVTIGIALGSDDHEARKRLVHRPDLGADVWQTLLHDPDRRVRSEIATECPDPEIIAILVRDDHPQVRASTVHSPHMTAADAELLATDRNATVRAAAATSHKLQPDTLTRLATDRSSQVRWCVLTANMRLQL